MALLRVAGFASMLLTAAGSNIFSCNIGDGAVAVDDAGNYTVFMSPAGSNWAQPWFVGEDIFFHVGSQDPGAPFWYSLANGSLSITSHSLNAGSDALGPFTEVILNTVTVSQTPTSSHATVAAAAPTAADASIRCYPSAGAVLFSLTFPNGVANASTELYLSLPHTEFNASRTPMAGFPVFPYTGDRVLGQLGYFEIQGRFSNDGNSQGVGMNNAQGGQTGGPMILFNTTADPGTGVPAAAVFAPFSAFHDVVVGANNEYKLLHAGPHGWLTSLPPGFSSQALLVLSARGVNAAMYDFGAALQVAYNTTRPPPTEDPLVTSLSYWTDNGAAYSCAFWQTSPPITAEQALRNMSAYYQRLGITIGTYQLDPWWPESTARVGCGSATNYAPNQVVFPNGLAHVGLPFTLYANFFATPSQGNLMTNWTWMVSEYINVGWLDGYISQVPSNESLAFFTDAFIKGVSWNANAFELDFQDFTGLTFDSFQSNAGDYRVWVQGINDAAAAVNATIQGCMSLPTDVLLSVIDSRFTNFRASEDDFPTNDGRWNIGATSMFIGSLGAAPFFDDTWTTKSQPSPYGPVTTGDPEANILMASLSAGPVGISDFLNYTNASLVLSACAANGVLLKPSRPSAPVDAMYTFDVPSGQVWAAPSFIPSQADRRVWNDVKRAPALRAGSIAPAGTTFYSVFGINVASTVTLQPQQLTPPADNTAGYLVTRWSPGFVGTAAMCANGLNVSAGCAAPFDATHPLQILTGGENPDRTKPHEVFYVSPTLNGFTLLGELSKTVRVSETRFAYLDCNGTALEVGVRGFGQETVDVAVSVYGRIIHTAVSFTSGSGVQLATLVCSMSQCSIVSLDHE